MATRSPAWIRPITRPKGMSRNVADPVGVRPGHAELLDPERLEVARITSSEVERRRGPSEFKSASLLEEPWSRRGVALEELQQLVPDLLLPLR